MENELLIEFLKESKKQTYANANVKKAPSSRLGSNDYHFEKDNMIYHDTYFGSTNFLGEEVVYYNNKPIWAMNYHGITVDSSLSEEAMDQALRPALMMVGEDNDILPLRGPSKLENNGYTYLFSSTGTIEEFEGKEEIYKDKKLIYKLTCHGGSIK